MEEEIFIHRLNGDKDQVKTLLRKSFAAYNANKENKQNEFFDRVIFLSMYWKNSQQRRTIPFGNFL